MAADKDAAKRRRQARNRQEREQRQKRIEGAKRSTEARTKADASGGGSGGARGSGGSGTSSSGSSAGGFLGRMFGPRPQAATEGTDGRPSRAQPTRSGSDGDSDASSGPGGRSTAAGRRRPTESRVVDVPAGGGLRGFVARSVAQPGGRATLLALLLSIVSGVTLLAFPVIPVPVLEGYGPMVIEDSGVSPESIQARLERFDDADPVVATVRFLDTPNPLFVAVFAVVPVLIAGVAARSLASPTRSRTLLISALAGAVYTFFTGAIGIYFFLGVICLGWASFQSRKADAMIAAADR